MFTQENSSFDEKLSVTQVAEEIGCHPNTVWNQIRGGQLNAVRFGPRLVRIRRSELERFLSSYRLEAKQGWLAPLERPVI